MQAWSDIDGQQSARGLLRGEVKLPGTDEVMQVLSQVMQKVS